MNVINLILKQMEQFGPLQWAMVAVALVWYMMPTIVAFIKKSPSKFRIMAANIFLGWSGLGWLFLMCWATFGERLFESSIKKKSEK